LRSSFASVSDDRSSASRVSLQDSVPSRGVGGGFELRPPVAGGFELRVGADSRFVTGESRELFSFVAGAPTRRRISGGDSATAGAFAEASLRRGRLTLSAGARLDHWRISDGELIERLLAGGPATRDDIYRDRQGWEPTARAGLAFSLASGWEARAAAYSGWRLPTLNELFRPFRAGADATAANPLLDPERLKGAEIGLRYRHDGADLDLTAFANRLYDAVANVTFGHGPGMFPGVGFVAGDFRQRQNVDAVRVRGVEASAAYARGPWSLRFGASWTSARVEADGAATPLDGLRPAQTPNLVLTGAIGWEDEGRTASLQVRHSGAQYEDDLNRERLAPATTLDAFVAWPVGKQVQVVARAQNLLDEEVQAGIGDDGAVERGTPRTLWVGLRVQPGQW
jgi:vitamin B12 transporter